MKGEILSIDTVSKMSENEKKIERLIRDKNILEKKLEKMQVDYDSLEQKNFYLEKREKTLLALEKSLVQRIKKYKGKKGYVYECISKELQFWNDMLSFEKEKTYEINEVQNEI